MAGTYRLHAAPCSTFSTSTCLPVRLSTKALSIAELSAVPAWPFAPLYGASISFEPFSGAFTAAELPW